MDESKTPWRTESSQAAVVHVGSQAEEKVGTGADQHDMARMGKMVSSYK